MGFSRQEYWTGLPCSPPGVFPNQGPNLSFLRLLHWRAGSFLLAPPGCPERTCTHTFIFKKHHVIKNLNESFKNKLVRSSKDIWSNLSSKRWANRPEIQVEGSHRGKQSRNHSSLGSPWGLSTMSTSRGSHTRACRNLAWWVYIRSFEQSAHRNHWKGIGDRGGSSPKSLLQ